MLVLCSTTMRAFRREIIDQNGNRRATIIGVVVPPYDVDRIGWARRRLFDYINDTIGYEGHNVFMNIERERVSAVVTYNLNGLDDEEFEL